MRPGDQQRAGGEYLLQPFDGEYTADECSGFDDTVPTIDVCFYDRYLWQATKMADHGEVWSLPWAAPDWRGQARVRRARRAFSAQARKASEFPRGRDPSPGLTPHQLVAVRPRLPVGRSHIDQSGRRSGTGPADGVQAIVGTFDVAGNFGAYGDEFT
jgi:hypothetical protein